MPVVASAPAAVSAVLAAVAAAVAALAAWRVRGTTAVPAAAWAVAACLALAGEMAVRSGAATGDPAAAAAVRLAVVALSLCPIMSLLGAKRPQHGVWQFIVATLAVVLALPAATALVVRPGSLPAVHPLERCLVAVVILVGWLNFIGTGRWGAATSVTLGQGLLARRFLPGAGLAEGIADSLATRADLVDLAGCGLVCAGTLLAAACSAPGRRRAPEESPDPAVAAAPLAAAVGPAFMAVRETFGAAWTLRIAERFDELAAARGWPCRLRFSGGLVAAVPTAAAAPEDWPRDARRALRALLLRFVSPEWLARHAWPADADPAADRLPKGAS